MINKAANITSIAHPVSTQLHYVIESVRSIAGVHALQVRCCQKQQGEAPEDLQFRGCLALNM